MVNRRRSRRPSFRALIEEKGPPISGAIFAPPGWLEMEKNRATRSRDYGPKRPPLIFAGMSAISVGSWRYRGQFAAAPEGPLLGP